MTGGADTRERLLQATIELLAGPGMAAVSARGIAARAEVNQGLVFYHFGSVTALVAQATRLSTENTVMLYRAALRAAGWSDLAGELIGTYSARFAEAVAVVTAGDFQPLPSHALTRVALERHDPDAVVLLGAGAARIRPSTLTGH